MQRNLFNLLLGGVFDRREQEAANAKAQRDLETYKKERGADTDEALRKASGMSAQQLKELKDRLEAERKLAAENQNDPLFPGTTFGAATAGNRAASAAGRFGEERDLAGLENIGELTRTRDKAATIQAQNAGLLAQGVSPFAKLIGSSRAQADVDAEINRGATASFGTAALPSATNAAISASNLATDQANANRTLVTPETTVRRQTLGNKLLELALGEAMAKDALTPEQLAMQANTARQGRANDSTRANLVSLLGKSAVRGAEQVSKNGGPVTDAITLYNLMSGRPLEQGSAFGGARFEGPSETIEQVPSGIGNMTKPEVVRRPGKVTGANLGDRIDLPPLGDVPPPKASTPAAPAGKPVNGSKDSKSSEITEKQLFSEAHDIYGIARPPNTPANNTRTLKQLLLFYNSELSTGLDAVTGLPLQENVKSMLMQKRAALLKHLNNK